MAESIIKGYLCRSWVYNLKTGESIPYEKDKHLDSLKHRYLEKSLDSLGIEGIKQLCKNKTPVDKAQFTIADGLVRRNF